MGFYHPSAEFLFVGDVVDGSAVVHTFVQKATGIVVARLADGRCYAFSPTDVVPLTDPVPTSHDTSWRVPVNLADHYMGTVEIGGPVEVFTEEQVLADEARVGA